MQPFVLNVMLLIYWASHKKIYWLTYFLSFFLVEIGIIDSDILCNILTLIEPCHFVESIGNIVLKLFAENCGVPSHTQWQAWIIPSWRTGKSLRVIKLPPIREKVARVLKNIVCILNLWFLGRNMPFFYQLLRLGFLKKPHTCLTAPSKVLPCFLH